MTLKLTVDTLDSVDEAVRGLYVEKDGKFTLNVEGVEDVSSLKNSLRDANREAENRRKQLDGWKKLGKSPDEITALIEAQAAADADKLSKAGEWDKLRQQMNDKHADDLKKKDETIGQMRARLEKELVDAQAVIAIAAAKGSTGLLLPHVKSHVKVDDNYQVIVVDAKGDPRVNGKGEPLTIADLVTEMRGTEAYGRAFEGTGQSGSGATQANGVGAIGAVTKRSDLKTRSERAAFVDKHGADTYFALPA